MEVGGYGLTSNKEKLEELLAKGKDSQVDYHPQVGRYIPKITSHSHKIILSYVFQSCTTDD